MSDDDLFAQAMRVVRPIEKPEKVTQKKTGLKKPVERKTIPHSATTSSRQNHVPPEFTENHWTLKASGVSAEKLKQLGAGKPAIDLEIDLHGMIRREALGSLEKVLETALSRKFRVLCIVHGRGLHSQGKPILKEAVYQWLKSGPYAGHVLAVIPKPYAGGGSCLVLLRRDRRAE